MAIKVRLMNTAPLDYTTPPWPSLYWPFDEKSRIPYYLYYTHDIWRYTLFWTLIMYAGTHSIVAMVGVLMHVGKSDRAWQYAWIIALAQALIVGVEAVLAGSIVGLVLGAVYESGYFKMSTWIPFIWGLINVLSLIISSFSFGGSL
ncbi:hypothetical protein K3495_g469 [Podosphaera aphanis]|nr:hypothetical protein K3495_g469 [Podosphaera aphanis]